ncbi:HAD-IIIA family hydrolase [Bacteroides fragilis]
MKNKAVFLDRDGTINVDYGYVYKPEDLVLLPGVIEALQLFQKAGYLLIVITNQSGVARGYFTEYDVNFFNGELKKKLALCNIVITDFFYVHMVHWMDAYVVNLLHN